MTIPLSLRATWNKGLTGAGLAAVLSIFFLTLPFGAALQNLSYDLPFLFKTIHPVDGVVIVYMDGPSLEELHQVWDDRWDRSLHAQLIDYLTRCHVRAVAFDVRFAGTNDPISDARLLEAAKANGKVVVASKMTPQISNGELIGWKLESAFEALRKVSLSGVVEESGNDKRVRQHFRNLDYKEPSLSWRAAQLAMTTPPADPLRERWVNYYGPPGFIPNISYVQALQDTNFQQAAFFSKKVVFVGAKFDVGYMGGKGTDDYATPYTLSTGRKSPGVEVNATTCLNLLRGDWLSRPSPWAETAAFIFLSALFGFGLAACRPLVASGLAVVVALTVAIGAVLLVWQTHIWIPWMIVVCVQIPVALGWSILAHTKRWQRERKSLEQALAMASQGEMARQSEESRQYVRRSLPSLDPHRQATSVSPKNAPLISDHELLRCIGRGAYGEVWLARDIIGNFHAVKILHQSNFKDARPLEREFNGIRKFTPISREHPGLVHILHVGRNEEAGYIYYIMELGDDQTSGQKIDPLTYSPKTLANELQNRKRLPLHECLPMLIHLADALDYLHRQRLIHRDIKPSNIIFVKGVSKFADIGLVTDVATDGRDATYVGTPGRIAPEGPGSPTSDIYSLGKVLY
ncbi:MAG TPA: serine/threonine-protein kinase, partial [Verrucomicrobiae bacterium]|nr:serine/threonine-protein kinase [Verrucomicrobiae bacterium]